MVRIHPDYKKRGGEEKGLTQATIGRTDLHKLYKNMGENEMQTIVRDPNDVIVQAILIKVHQEKPKPDCKEYKLINDLLAGLEREEKSKIIAQNETIIKQEKEIKKEKKEENTLSMEANNLVSQMESLVKSKNKEA